MMSSGDDAVSVTVHTWVPSQLGRLGDDADAAPSPKSLRQKPASSNNAPSPHTPTANDGRGAHDAAPENNGQPGSPVSPSRRAASPDDGIAHDPEDTAVAAASTTGPTSATAAAAAVESSSGGGVDSRRKYHQSGKFGSWRPRRLTIDAQRTRLRMAKMQGAERFDVPILEIIDIQRHYVRAEHAIQLEGFDARTGKRLTTAQRAALLTTAADQSLNPPMNVSGMVGLKINAGPSRQLKLLFTSNEDLEHVYDELSEVITAHLSHNLFGAADEGLPAVRDEHSVRDVSVADSGGELRQSRSVVSQARPDVADLVGAFISGTRPEPVVAATKPAETKTAGNDKGLFQRAQSERRGLSDAPASNGLPTATFATPVPGAGKTITWNVRPSKKRDNVLKLKPAGKLGADENELNVATLIVRREEPVKPELVLIDPPPRVKKYGVSPSAQRSSKQMLIILPSLAARSRWEAWFIDHGATVVDMTPKDAARDDDDDDAARQTSDERHSAEDTATATEESSAEVETVVARQMRRTFEVDGEPVREVEHHTASPARARASSSSSASVARVASPPAADRYDSVARRHPSSPAAATAGSPRPNQASSTSRTAASRKVAPGPRDRTELPLDFDDVSPRQQPRRRLSISPRSRPTLDSMSSPLAQEQERSAGAASSQAGQTMSSQRDGGTELSRGRAGQQPRVTRRTPTSPESSSPAGRRSVQIASPTTLQRNRTVTDDGVDEVTGPNFRLSDRGIMGTARLSSAGHSRPRPLVTSMFRVPEPDFRRRADDHLREHHDEDDGDEPSMFDDEEAGRGPPGPMRLRGFRSGRSAATTGDDGPRSTPFALSDVADPEEGVTAFSRLANAIAPDARSTDASSSNQAPMPRRNPALWELPPEVASAGTTVGAADHFTFNFTGVFAGAAAESNGSRSGFEPAPSHAATIAGSSAVALHKRSTTTRDSTDRRRRAAQVGGEDTARAGRSLFFAQSFSLTDVDRAANVGNDTALAGGHPSAYSESPSASTTPEPDLLLTSARSQQQQHQPPRPYAPAWDGEPHPSSGSSATTATNVSSTRRLGFFSQAAHYLSEDELRSATASADARGNRLVVAGQPAGHDQYGSAMMLTPSTATPPPRSGSSTPGLQGVVATNPAAELQATRNTFAAERGMGAAASRRSATTAVGDYGDALAAGSSPDPCAICGLDKVVHERCAVSGRAHRVGVRAALDKAASQRATTSSRAADPTAVVRL